jgi:hypothetical protein
MTNIQKHNLILYAIFIITLSSCTKKHEDLSDSTTSSSTELTYCSPVAVSNPATISGSATYTARNVTSTGLKGSTTYPIRFAEVEVRSLSSDALIQCGLTDGSGNFALQVEVNGAADTQYTVNINSRGFGDAVRASVLTDINQAHLYTISTTVTLSAGSTTGSAGTLNATYTGTVLSGAFNIFDQILKANEYLRANSSCTGCTTFTVAPKVTVYWKIGFTPAAYISASYSSSPLSFFDSSASITATPSLYILGGLNNDVNSSDTDHFDNSVIIHEYAHFLEYSFAKSDSPGGSHNGNLIIDPRLAWSEGWADFFSAAVLGVSYYRDTVGNEEGTTMTSIDLNFSTPSPNQDLISNKSTIGEGVFREVSVSRSLYNYSKINFSDIWKTFSDSTTGFANLNFHFRNMGLFNQQLLANASSANATQINTIRTAEYQRADSYEYSDPVTLKSVSCSRTLTPTGDYGNPFYDSADASSQPTIPNMFTSNDFFYYYHPGGAFNITLTYNQVGSSPTDLDLYIYQEAYVWRDSRTVLLKSDAELAAENPTRSESVSGNLPAGFYLINVSAYTQKGLGHGATYDLKSGVEFLCP